MGVSRCGAGLCVFGKLESSLASAGSAARDSIEAFLLKLTLDGDPVWVRKIGAWDPEHRFIAASVAANARGDVVVAGACRGPIRFPAAGGEDVVVDCAGDSPQPVVARLDSSGEHLWHHVLGPAGSIPVRAHVEIDREGHTLVAGNLSGEVGGSRAHAFLSMFDQDGAELFQRQLIGPVAYPSGLGVDAVGDITMIGFFAATVALSSNSGGADVEVPTAGSGICAIKFSAAGAHLWSKCFDGDNLQALDPQLALGADGSVHIAGSLSDEHAIDFGAYGPDEPTPSRLRAEGSPDVYLGKLSADGNLAWQRQIGGEGNQTTSLGFAVASDGTVITPGLSNGDLALEGALEPPDVGSTLFVQAFNESGSPLWGTRLDDYASATASNSVAIGECRTVYFALAVRSSLRVVAIAY